MRLCTPEGLPTSINIIKWVWVLSGLFGTIPLIPACLNGPQFLHIYSVSERYDLAKISLVCGKIIVQVLHLSLFDEGKSLVTHSMLPAFLNPQ